MSIDAVLDRFLLQLAPEKHELVIFDTNRFAPITTLMHDDPGPVTQQLLRDDGLPFAVTLVANESKNKREVIVARKEPYTGSPRHVESLGMSWPPGVFSLSPLSLTFPPDDPIYGRYPPEDRNRIFLGYQAVQGERGVLKISPNFLLRLRHNPFYAYLEGRVVDWLMGHEKLRTPPVAVEHGKSNVP